MNSTIFKLALSPIIFLCFTCSSQIEGTRFSYPKADSISVIDVNNLADIGKVWGFLKYYHPQVIPGNYDWDKKLLEILPQILSGENERTLNELIIELIPTIQQFNKEKIIQECDSLLKIKPNYAWINELGIENKTKEKLKSLIELPKPVRSDYVSFGQSNSPTFNNERGYSNVVELDYRYRLLCLFRYWNVIQYYYPYRYSIPGGWDKVINDLIPKFYYSDSQLSYHLSILEMISRIQDTHSADFTTPTLEIFKGEYMIPIKIRFVEDKPIVYSFSKFENSSFKLLPGDVIVKVNGKHTHQITSDWSPFIPASNEAAKLRQIAIDIIPRSKTDSAFVTIDRDGQIYEFKIKCEPRRYTNPYDVFKNNDSHYTKLSENIGYINPWGCKEDLMDKLLVEIKKTSGIIIDLRYAFYDPPFNVISYVLGKPRICVKETSGTLSKPGAFHYSKEVEFGKKTDEKFNGKLIILNNEFTQSSAEYTTMVFQTYEKCIVVGSTTAGADGAVSSLILPGGLRTIFSGYGVYYPDGSETQRVGIKIDNHIELAISDIIGNVDPLLNKAIELIEND